MAGAIITYEESGADTGRRHRHNGYSSGFGASGDHWRDQRLGDPPHREPSSAGVRIGNPGLTPADVAICGRGPTWTVAGQPCARQ